MLLFAVGIGWAARNRVPPASQEAAGRAAVRREDITLDSPVLLHGPVEKQGPLALLSLLHGGRAERSELVFPQARQRCFLACFLSRFSTLSW